VGVAGQDDVVVEMVKGKDELLGDRIVPEGGGAPAFVMPDGDGALLAARLAAVAAAHGRLQPLMLRAPIPAGGRLGVPGRAVEPLTVGVQDEHIPVRPAVAVDVEVAVVVAEVGTAWWSELGAGEAGELVSEIGPPGGGAGAGFADVVVAEGGEVADAFEATPAAVVADG
jgi:hypothetical protein